MVVLRTALFTTALFLACWFTLPSPAIAGGKNHGGGGSGIATLLTAGVVASVLQNRGGGGGGGGGGFGGGRSAVPIGGHHQEYRHGAPSMHEPQGRGAYGPPPMHYGPPMQPMMPYGQPVQYAPQQTMNYMQPAQVPFGHYPGFQPTDNIEVIRM